MQRDLFKADVMAFPLARTIEVARMARFLHAVHGPRAQAYYVKRCRELAKRIKAAGLDDYDARQQIAAFQEAVQRELCVLGNVVRAAQG